MRHPLVQSAPLALLLLFGQSAPLLADVEAECRRLAQDEEVPAEDLKDFVAECMAAADTEIPEPQDEGEDEPQGGTRR